MDQVLELIRSGFGAGQCLELGRKNERCMRSGSKTFVRSTPDWDTSGRLRHRESSHGARGTTGTCRRAGSSSLTIRYHR